MKKTKKQTILEDYDSYEAVPAAVKAWITMDAVRDGKSPTMAHAGYKAAFKRIQNQTTLTIIKEDGGYLGGCCSAVPFHHIVKSHTTNILKKKVGAIYDEVVEALDKDSKEYKEAMRVKDVNIVSLIEDQEEIDIDGTKLQIISDPDYVTFS